MQIVPYDHQYQGADFLVENGTALLADEPRVGKTGAAIMAADNLDCSTILVVTTVSGRAVWRRAFDDWSDLGRSIPWSPAAAIASIAPRSSIVGWPSIIQPTIRAQLLARRWDVLISDEDHFAKSFGAKRTQSLYGQLLAGGVGLDTVQGAVLARCPRLVPDRHAAAAFAGRHVPQAARAAAGAAAARSGPRLSRRHPLRGFPAPLLHRPAEDAFRPGAASRW